MNRHMWIFIHILTLATATVASNCNRVRSSWNDEDNIISDQSGHIDLSQLSDQQLDQLMKQLQQKVDTMEFQNPQDASYLEGNDDNDDDHRGSSRPWNKIQRIIRRQLVRIPKRYLKKFLRQFGLARSGSSSSISTKTYKTAIIQPQLYYLIPLD
ncbi:uncharacterized protein Dwil_GK18853 [Drosophila willistoni]|uniref:Uncharacterized protein n=1 Tax=Drosophila willistoni TaxID=7260 RepID=B4NDX6_DROWI|nr:uncharacterized protein LOC6648655 [Drosophila willistoni]EDW81945.2 uncharacterized protein Dwil_GK18853 [Drosophila willistoni]